MNQTSAIILKDSINKQGDRLTTFRLTYPRIILAELNTHRVYSKNTSSSRAIPVKDNIERIRNDPFIPGQWVKNARGMFSLDYIDNNLEEIMRLWLEANYIMGDIGKNLAEYELHKQYANRLLEPFMYVDTILTGTDFNNFFYLRTAEDAQPEIQELANCMYEVYSESTPDLLYYGEWHVPYIDTIRENDSLTYSINDQIIDIDTAIKIAISCCGQVSYRKLNTTIEKALEIYAKFMNNSRLHASPLEHVATPFSDLEYESRIKVRDLLQVELGDNISSFDLEKILYKRNFKGWTQYRTLIPNDTYTEKFTK